MSNLKVPTFRSRSRSPIGGSRSVSPLAPIFEDSPILIKYQSADSGLERISVDIQGGTTMDTPVDQKNASILTAKTSFNDKSARMSLRSVCLVGECSNDDELLEALNKLQIQVVSSESGVEYIEQDDVAFVVNDFSGPVFESLLERKRSIFGPTALKEMEIMKTGLHYTRRPLYCRSMDGIIACLSAFSKTVLEELVNLIHYMGGSVRATYSARVTHVISASTQKEKYRLAVAAGVPIMSEEWVRKAWERRSNKLSYAFSEEMKVYKLPAFFRLKLAFHGFSPDDLVAMEERARELGAEITSEPSECTHLVVNNTENSADIVELKLPSEFCRVVSGKWFWTSAQLEICANENEYCPFEKGKKDGIMSPADSKSTSIRFPRSSRSSFGTLNAASHFENSNDASGCLDNHMFTVDDLESFVKSPPKRSKRYLNCEELLGNETRNIAKLRVIISTFKRPLEQEGPYGDFYMPAMDVKTIFGNIEDILAVHEKIRPDLANFMLNWSEKSCIGKIWLDHLEEIKKCYQPYINFYEGAKEKIAECKAKYRRFYSFLKNTEGTKECERQGLTDLLMHSVQYLPRVVLVFAEIRKNTDRSHEDQKYLKLTIDGLNNVLKSLNEGKRQTEGQIQMLQIVNEIEDCPAYLLSSHRQLILEIDVNDLSGEFCKKKTSILTLYLFNDCLEIAKKRQKSPNNDRRMSISKSTLKTRKHLDLVLLHRIRRVVNVTGVAATPNLFCLTIRDNLSDTDYTFSYLGPSGRREMTGSNSSLDLATKKAQFMDTMCNYVMLATGRAEFHCENHEAQCQDDSQLTTAIRKAAKRITADDVALKPTASFKSLRPSGASTTGTFRRSISQAGQVMMGRLRRVSRSNLRLGLHGIMEEAANLSKGKNDSLNDSKLKIDN